MRKPQDLLIYSPPNEKVEEEEKQESQCQIQCELCAVKYQKSRSERNQILFRGMIGESHLSVYESTGENLEGIQDLPRINRGRRREKEEEDSEVCFSTVALLRSKWWVIWKGQVFQSKPERFQKTG